MDLGMSCSWHISSAFSASWHGSTLNRTCSAIPRRSLSIVGWRRSEHSMYLQLCSLAKIFPSAQNNGKKIVFISNKNTFICWSILLSIRLFLWFHVYIFTLILYNILRIAAMHSLNNFFYPIKQCDTNRNSKWNEKVLPSLGIYKFPRSSLLARRNTGDFTLYLFRNWRINWATLESDRLSAKEYTRMYASQSRGIYLCNKNLL